MLKLKVVGNIFGCSGYAVHTKSLVNELYKFDDLEVSLECQLPNNWTKLVNDAELDMIKKNSQYEYDVVLLISLPTAARQYICTDKPIIQYVIWEGDKIPASWIDILMHENIKQIWVASEHTRDAICNTFRADASTYDYMSGYHHKIKIIPHGVDSKLFYPKEVKKDKFTFVVSKGWRNLEDRGGTQYAVKAFFEEFSAEDDVKMLIKLNPAYGIPNLDKMINELKPKDKTSFAQIDMSISDLPYEKMVDVYNSGDVFVAPTRAEAFHFGCIEAMACGLPVITTTFGGQTDFCTKETGWLIGGELKEVEHDLEYENIKWLNPDISELQIAMRESVTSSLVEKKANAIKTAKEYTWINSAKIAHNHIIAIK